MVLITTSPVAASLAIRGVRDVVEVQSTSMMSVLTRLEGFSSQGPCELFSPTHEFRTKPDVAALMGSTPPCLLSPRSLGRLPRSACCRRRGAAH